MPSQPPAPQYRHCNRPRRLGLVGLLGVCLSSHAQTDIPTPPIQPPSELRYCVQAASFTRGQELLQTRQLHVHLRGPAAGDLQTPLVIQAARAQLWPEADPPQPSRELRVDADPFDPAICGNAPSAELTLHYSAEQLTQLRKELRRGEAAAPTAQAIARQARAVPGLQPAMQPPPTTPQAHAHQWFKLYFATNRQPTQNTAAAQAFGPQQVAQISMGTVDVSIPYDHRWAKLESPSIFELEWDAAPDRHVMLGPQLTRLAPPAWRQQLSQRATALGKPGVLLFVHGYNTSFEAAALRAAQLGYDLGFKGPTVLFSWPSDGSLLAYTRDEEDARTAWRQMADVLDALTQLGPGVPVYIVAHSMGNRVLTEGLAHLLQRRPGADRALRQVVLAAPDVGQEEFRQRWLWDLKSANPPRYTLYASGHDLPVAASAWLHGQKRLGSGGAQTPVFDGMDSIDASPITQEWFGLNHSYFGDNHTVLSDLFTLIHHGLPPAQRPRLRPVNAAQGTFWEFQP